MKQNVQMQAKDIKDTFPSVWVVSGSQCPVKRESCARPCVLWMGKGTSRHQGHTGGRR